MIIHSTDINLPPQGGAYELVYADPVKARTSPPVRVASAGPVSIGQGGGPAPRSTIKGTAPCSISHVYGGGGGVIAECDGKPVSVAWPSSEDLTASSGRHGAHDQARRVLLKFMDGDGDTAVGKPSVFTSVLMALTMLALCVYATTFSPGSKQ